MFTRLHHKIIYGFNDYQKCGKEKYILLFFSEEKKNKKYFDLILRNFLSRLITAF